MVAWAPIAAAGIQAAGSLFGGMMGTSGQSAANAANINLQSVANAQNLAHAQWVQSQQNDAFWANFHNQNEQAAINRQWSSDQAQRQMDWQASMSNTAYQRAMADMRAAGLNPILAYKQGGSSSPAGAMGQGSMPGTAGGPGSTSAGQSAARVSNDKEIMSRALGNVASSAIEAYKTSEQAKLTSEQQEFTKEQTRRVGYETTKMDAETGRILEETNNAKVTNRILRAQEHTARAQAVTAALEADNMGRYGRKEAPDTVERILRTIQGWFEQSGGVDVIKGLNR